MRTRSPLAAHVASVHNDGLGTYVVRRRQSLRRPFRIPKTLATGRQLGRTIHQCLAAFGEDRRLAVTLHLQGHTVAEASHVLGWSEKRVANLTYRGLSDVRRSLAARGVTGSPAKVAIGVRGSAVVVWERSSREQPLPT